MLGSEILDVGIGLALVYLLLSLIASAVREGIEGALKMRASYLERGLRELLSDANGTGLVREFYNHPQISGLFAGSYDPEHKRNLPSYIPARNFALALVDLTAHGPDGENGANEPNRALISLQLLREGTANLPPSVRRSVLSAIDTADGDLAAVQQNLEDWFDSCMDRVSGWYKRRTQWIILVIGALLAIAMNVNTLALMSFLSQQKAARETVVAAASADSALRGLSASALAQRLDALKLPIGWSQPLSAGGDANESLLQWVLRLLGIGLGWLLTTFAVSLGAPFWFDVLNRFVVIRSTVKPHEKSPEEASQDRQSDGQPSVPQGQRPRLRAANSEEPGYLPNAWAVGDPQEGKL